MLNQNIISNKFDLKLTTTLSSYNVTLGLSYKTFLRLWLNKVDQRIGKISPNVFFLKVAQTVIVLKNSKISSSMLNFQVQKHLQLWVLKIPTTDHVLKVPFNGKNVKKYFLKSSPKCSISFGLLHFFKKQPNW